MSSAAAAGDLSARTKSLSIIPHFTGALSILGSSQISYSILRDRRRRQRTSQRILLALSLCDIISSFAYFLSTWPLPQGENAGWDEPYHYAASGNDATCTAQGVMIQFGVVSAFYNVALSVQYLLVVRYNVRESTLRSKYGPWMLAVPPVLALGLTLPGLFLGMYANSNLWCWIATNWNSCPADDEAQAEMCVSRTNMYRFVFYYGPLWASMALTLVAQGVVWKTVREIETKSRRYVYRRGRSSLYSTDRAHSIAVAVEGAAAAAAEGLSGLGGTTTSGGGGECQVSANLGINDGSARRLEEKHSSRNLPRTISTAGSHSHESRDNVNGMEEEGVAHEDEGKDVVIELDEESAARDDVRGDSFNDSGSGGGDDDGSVAWARDDYFHDEEDVVVAGTDSSPTEKATTMSNDDEEEDGVIISASDANTDSGAASGDKSGLEQCTTSLTPTTGEDAHPAAPHTCTGKDAGDDNDSKKEEESETSARRRSSASSSSELSSNDASSDGDAETRVERRHRLSSISWANSMSFREPPGAEAPSQGIRRTSIQWADRSADHDDSVGGGGGGTLGPGRQRRLSAASSSASTQSARRPPASFRTPLNYSSGGTAAHPSSPGEGRRRRSSARSRSSSLLSRAGSVVVEQRYLKEEDRHAYRQSRKIAKQARLYFLVFFITWFPYSFLSLVLNLIMKLWFKPSNDGYWMLLVIVICQPLQGFLNCLVYNKRKIRSGFRRCLSRLRNGRGWNWGSVVAGGLPTSWNVVPSRRSRNATPHPNGRSVNSS